MNDLDAQFDEYKQALEDEFFRLVDAGMSNYAARREAKKNVREVYPDIAQMMFMAMRNDGDPQHITARQMIAKMTGYWNRLNMIADERRGKSDPHALLPIPVSLQLSPLDGPSMVEAAIPESSGGNGSNQRSLPKLILYPSGKSNVTATILNVITAINPKPGDVLHFGNMKIWGAICGFSDYAIPNLIQGIGNSFGLTRAGYTFEVLDKSAVNFTARVVTVPMTERDREIADLEKVLEDAAAKLAALKSGK